MSAQPALLIPTEPLFPVPEDLPMPRGAQILIQALVHEGVDSIFGYPGVKRDRRLEIECDRVAKKQTRLLIRLSEYLSPQDRVFLCAPSERLRGLWPRDRARRAPDSCA